ncbi:response regulator transcription factor [Streptomyces sp. NPDC026589]|uniref:helix-turn-helix transcriptional regulator n=1 Tax=Streptomyces sp. NPDC026589 TaxID=3155609 RepID=UPI0033C45CE2
MTIATEPQLRFVSGTHGRGPLTLSSTEPITVCVRAADPLSRAGVVAQLGPRPEVRLRSSEESSPGVLLLVTDAVDDDVQVQLRRTQRTSETRTVLLVTAIDGQQLLSAAECGIGGIVRRADATPEHLVEVITSVARGQAYLPGDLLAQFLSEFTRVQQEVLAPRGLCATRLSPREREVLRRLAEGQDTAQIAESLSFSVRTIKNTLQKVMIRYQLPNRTAAVAFAMREGLI